MDIRRYLLAVICMFTLLMGVTSDPQAVDNKVEECTLLAQKVLNDTSSLDIHCGPLTTCIKTAMEMFDSSCVVLDKFRMLQNIADNLCSADGICLQKITVCQAKLMDGVQEEDTVKNVFNATYWKKMCSLYQPVTACLKNVATSEQCRNQEGVNAMLAGVSMSASFCNNTCPEIFPCFAHLEQLDQSQICHSLDPLMECLTSALRKCHDEDAKILDAIAPVLTPVCEEVSGNLELMKCSELTECLMTSVIPSDLLASFQGVVNEDTMVIASIEDLMKNVTSYFNQEFVCSTMESAVTCLVSNAEVCGFNENFVTKMTQQEYDLMKACHSGETSDSQAFNGKVRSDEKSDSQAFNGKVRSDEKPDSLAFYDKLRECGLLAETASNDTSSPNKHCRPLTTCIETAEGMSDKSSVGLNSIQSLQYAADILCSSGKTSDSQAFNDNVRSDETSDSQAFYNKVRECALLAETAANDTSSPDKHCRSLTTCIKTAKGMSDKSSVSLNISQSLQDAADSLCSSDRVCMLKMSACGAKLMDVVQEEVTPKNVFNATYWEKMCSLQQPVMDCMKNVATSEQCRNQERVNAMLAGISTSASFCNDMCPEIFPCFAHVEQLDQSQICHSVDPLMECLTSALRKCHDENAKILDDIAPVLTPVCEVVSTNLDLIRCSKVTECLMTSVIPSDLLASFQGVVKNGQMAIASIGNLMKNMTSYFNEEFVCSTMESAVTCLVSNAEVCGFHGEDVVNSITEEQRDLMKTCVSDELAIFSNLTDQLQISVRRFADEYSGVEALTGTVRVILSAQVLLLWLTRH